MAEKLLKLENLIGFDNLQAKAESILADPKKAERITKHLNRGIYLIVNSDNLPEINFRPSSEKHCNLELYAKCGNIIGAMNERGSDVMLESQFGFSVAHVPLNWPKINNREDKEAYVKIIYNP